VDANIREVKAKIRTVQEEMMARLEAMIQNNQENMLAKMGNQPRKDDDQVRYPLQKDDNQDGIPARENVGRNGRLQRKDEQNGHHEFGGQLRKVSYYSGVSGSP
jgi:hypothetical protein